MSRVIFFSAIALASAAPAFAAAYFSELSDVPMPPGFIEQDTAVGVDGAGGRLVVARAAGDMPPSAVRDFYVESLPQLGWGFSPGEDALTFVRNRERLSLSIREWEGRTVLQANLVVRAAPSNGD